MHIIMDIGCIECCVPTQHVASFTSREAAHAVCAALEHKRRRERDTDHEFEVFEIPFATQQSRVSIANDYVEQVEACGVAYMEL